MTRRNEGAAIRQDHRSRSNAARNRMPAHSIPAWEAEEEWSAPKTIAVSIAGAFFLYACMWLAAAY